MNSKTHMVEAPSAPVSAEVSEAIDLLLAQGSFTRMQGDREVAERHGAYLPYVISVVDAKLASLPAETRQEAEKFVELRKNKESSRELTLQATAANKEGSSRTETLSEKVALLSGSRKADVSAPELVDDLGLEPELISPMDWDALFQQQAMGSISPACKQPFICGELKVPGKSGFYNTLSLSRELNQARVPYQFEPLGKKPEPGSIRVEIDDSWRSTILPVPVGALVQQLGPTRSVLAPSELDPVVWEARPSAAKVCYDLKFQEPGSRFLSISPEN